MDTIYDIQRARGGDCVFFCFTPPHKAPVHLRCPTIWVFAWKFSNIPDEAPDGDPRSDWRTVSARQGRAIAVPLARRFASLGQRGAGTEGVITIRGRVYESRACGPRFERPLWTPEPEPEIEPEPAAVDEPLPSSPRAGLRLRTSIGVSRYYGLL